MKMSAWLWLLTKALGFSAIVGALALSVHAFQEHLREQGRVEVREQWLKADNARQAQERAALIAMQQAERANEQRMAIAKEEKDREQIQREQALRDRAAAADRAVAGLRRAVARLNADSVSRRAESACPAAGREADEAATARELLGACASRYSELGARAGALAAQVTGLQDHIVVAQPEAAALLEPEEQ